LNQSENQPRSVSEAINQLASNNTSGAAEILRQARDVFKQLNAATQDVDLQRVQKAILDTCIALATAQPEMTPLIKLASAVLSAARKTSDPRDSLNRAEGAAETFIENSANGAHAASLVAATLIQDGVRVLTHSRSSTVLTGFIEARHAGRNLSVVATESRPMLEGRELAAALARERIPVTLIADAAAALVLDEIDLVMLGADKIAPGILVNKIGTGMIALAARHRGLPLYAVCDSSKFIGEDYLNVTARRERNAGELWPDAPRGVTVVNNYFESTPLEIFSGIVTEDGVLSITDASRRAEEATIDTALISALGIKPEEIK
jgi:translation initiation factor eIF-2B subunit delta